MDLWNTFDTIKHSFLLTQLDAYGFFGTSLKLMQTYLWNWQQRVSINGTFGNWNEVITGALQGSILSLLLFNVFLTRICMFISKCSHFNYVDASTLYSSEKYLNIIKENLEMDFMIYTNGFMRITWY